MKRPQPFDCPIYVTRPLLPPLEDFVGRLSTIWSTSTLTNLGVQHDALERAIGTRFGVEHTSLWCNGTTALLGALHALELSGSVVVSPFTFPATVHAVRLLGLEPVFADVDEEWLTLDPARVRERADSRTAAILPTHVYGTLCDVAGLGALARELELRLVYDGAHLFGAELPRFAAGTDALGDATMLSFHATKLFHTAEGGALLTSDPELDRKFRLVRNFGIKNEDEVEGLGLNGKMSEIHAALGLAVLELVDREIARRRALVRVYQEALAGLPGLRFVPNHSVQYLVVRVAAAQFGCDRDTLQALLRTFNVFSRKYFHPPCCDLPAYADLPSARDLPHTRRAAAEVLALPLHGALTAADAERVAAIIRWHHESAG
jgi:dTDP-4-amino-4,6-dideoxygalactose transaminase